MARSKVSIVGAGNVGATCAHWLASRGLADVVLVDIVAGLARGKALDLAQAAPAMGFSQCITGTGDYEGTENSDVVVITAGVPRRKDPATGQFPSRDELVRTNQDIVGEVTREVARRSPNSVLLVVSNPLDAMCHVALEESGFPPQRVVGQAGALDTARYKAFIAMELGLSVSDVHGMVLGGHGDTMVPLPRHTSVAGIPLRELLAEDRLQAIIERTRGGGGEIVGLLGYSGYYAPSAATAEMVEAILRDQKRVIPSAVLLQGEYGLGGIYMGVPAVLGAGGVERVLEMALDEDERRMLMRSAEAVRSVVTVLGYPPR